MKFRGFRASLNFATGKQTTSEFAENITPVSVSGAYRTSTDEFYDNGSLPVTPKKITPSMVKLPKAFQPDPTDPDVIRATKSTTNLVQVTNLPPNLTQSTPNVSLDPRGATPKGRNSTDLRNTNAKDAKSQTKEQKKLEKKRLAEQKKTEKLEAQKRAKEEKLRKEAEKFEMREQAKLEKLRKDKEKTEAQQQAKTAKQDKKAAPKARNPLARGNQPANPTNPSQSDPAGYSTDTLDSSISKTSGPPPYPDDVPMAINPALVQNESDDTGNTSFGQPIQSDNTWDLISQHRQQIARVPLPVGGKKTGAAKPKVMRFKLADPNSNNNDGVTGRKSLYV